MRIPKWAEGVLQSAGLVDAPANQTTTVSDELLAKPRTRVIESGLKRTWRQILKATDKVGTVLYRQRLTELLEFENAVQHFESVVQLDRRNVDFVVCDSKGRIRLCIFVVDSRVMDQKFSWQQDLAMDILARAGIKSIRVEVSSETLEDEVRQALPQLEAESDAGEEASPPSVTSVG